MKPKKGRLERHFDWNGYKRWFRYKQEREVRKEVGVYRINALEGQG